MTSTNDGKEVKSYQTSAPKGKTYFIELYKSLETRLNESVTASERTKHLCEAWRRVHSLCVHSASTTHPHLLSWLQRHTARAILQTKWTSPERKDDRLSLEEAINVFIVESNSAAAAREGVRPQWEVQLVARGEWFKKVLEHPWKHPVLNCLLNPNETPPTNDEVLEWLIEERGVTFVMRLHTLVSEKCDDIAMSLATAVMERVRSCSAPVSDNSKDKPEQTALNFGNRLKEEAGFTVDVWEMLTDIEFVLLHKLDRSRCIALAKRIPLRTAYQLIERLQSRLDISPREKKLWKNSKEVAVLIAQVVITRCMMVAQCTGDVRSALYCCSRSLVRLTASSRLASAAAALAAPAATAAHLHTLAAAVDAQLAQRNEVGMKPFVCELYVRAITAGMNELERLKLITEKETEARSMEQMLATWFVQLGAVLSSSDRVKCECALTAFSVHPSPQMYERIKAAPVLPSIHIPEAQETSLDANPEFGSWASDSRSQTNFVKTSETLNMKARQNQANVLSTAILTEGETLGLSPELCQDITVLLSGPRVKTLSWDMDRELLLENCRAYLERTHGGTKAVTTELKYLNLNPADFQYLPEEDDDESNIYYGIEKGYEHLVEFQEPEEIWEDACKKADTSYLEKMETSYSSDEFDFIQPQRKKKTKKPASPSDEDDPLSLVAESKKKEKRERPHSKERSKDKKKITDSLKKKESGDPLELANQQKKEKPKKERKKKAHKQTDSSLANLVGLKVGKSKSTPVHQDSDAESQGRSSVRSINSEETILYDGVFSMDDMRSPRSSHSSDSAGLMQMHESIMANHMPRNPFNRPYRPTSASGIRIASPSPSDRLRNDSPNKISEETKGSLTKLLEYRRQKALEERRIPSAIIRRQGSTSMDKINISPKGVAIPEIPKSYISKQTDTSLHKQTSRNPNQRRLDTAIPSPVIQYASKSTSPEKPSRALYSQYYNSVQADRTTTSDCHFSTPPLADNFLDSVNSISIYDKNAPSHSRYPYDKTPSYSDVSQDSRRPEVDTSYSNYKDYIQEFSPLDAYSQYLQKREACMKTMRYSNNVSPVVPNKKSEHKSPQSAKQVPQKKPDGSLNTFARMSYYKNKQTDIKKSQVTQHSVPQAVGSNLDGFIMNHLHAQSSVSSFNSANSQASPKNIRALKGNEKPQGMMSIREREHPLLSNMLQTNLTNANVHQKMVSPAKSVLSDKDQNDLLLLLRQQNLLNNSQNSAVTSSCKSHNTLNTQVASGSNTISFRADAISDTNVPSRFIPKPSKPNEALNKVSEAKMINVLSTSIIKTADKKPKNPKESSPRIMKIPTENKPKKGKAKSKGPHNIAPKLEPHRNPEEWENVMNAILKQKTPCRGPNALEMTLNKSSFEKAFEDSLRKPPLFLSPIDSSVRSTIISQTESIHEEFVNSSQSSATFTATQTVTKTKKTTYTPLKIPHRPAVLKKNSAKNKMSSQTTSTLDAAVDKLIKQQQIDDDAVERLMHHNHIEITKHTSSITVLEIPEVTHKHSNCEKSTKIVQQRHVETSKINVQQNHVETLKKTVKQNNAHLHKKHAKQVVGETHKKEKQAIAQINQLKYVGLKQDDPFISGIPNSDYDLLEELMDDDLRKEIGELSSDEESYQTQGYTKVTKAGQKPGDVAYRAMNDSSFKAPISNAHQQMCKQYEMPQSSGQSSIQPPHGKEHVHVKNSPVMSAQSKPVICSNANNAQNVTTQYVMTQSTQARPCSSASLLRSAQTPVDTNMYITVPRPAPVQNVLLIPSELVNDSYPSAHNSMQAAHNVSQNTYITVTNTPSISMYQTTPFLPAVATPLIITSAVVAPVVNNISIAAVQPIPTTKVSETEYSFSSDVLQQPSHLATSQGNIVVDGNKLEVKSTSSLLNTTDKDIPQKTETKISADDNEIVNAESKVLITSADDNESTNADRKVLKEVQEKHDDENIDCKRKIQKANSKDLKTQVDKERLKKKRIAILNRKITNVCGIQTIALGYSPLQHSTNTEKKDDDVTHVKDVVQSNETVLHESSNDINSPATPDSHKENKNEPTQVRRILLRSSNKLKSKLSATTSSKPSLDKKIKKPISTSSNTPSETPSKIEQNDIEIKNKQIRVTKRVRNKSVISLKDNKNEEMKVQVVVQKEPTVASKCYKKKAKNALLSKIENPISKIDLDMEKSYDIGTDHLDSTITKNETVDSNKPDPPKISSPTTVEEKIVESLFPDKAEVVSLPVENEDELQHGLPVNETTKPSEQEKICKQTIQPTEITSVNITTTSEETNKINDDLLIMGAINSVLVEGKVKEIEKVVIQENDERLKINIIEKEIISKAKESIQPDKIKTNDKTTYSSIKVNSPDTNSTPEIILPIEFVNIPLPPKVHPSNNLTNKEIVQTLDKSPTGAKENSAETTHSNDINSICIKHTQEIVNLNKSQEVVAPQSQVTALDDDDDDIEIVGDIPNISTQEKNVQSNPSLNSIVIEEISGEDNNNPLKKNVRIKLGNGKVFRGTVSGTVDVTNLLDDPEIKSLLMSQFEESKKLYSLKLNVSKKPNGSQILPTCIQKTLKPQIPQTVETVSLLSDDEEDDSPKMFETEFGKHKIAPMDDDLFKKHQKKLIIKSFVPVKKLSLDEENDIINRSRTIIKANDDINTQISKECVIIDDTESPPIWSKKINDAKIISTIPSKYVQGIFNDIENILAPSNVQKQEEPIVLIDDSSNDSIDIKNKPEAKEKIDELKNMLLKDLGVDDLLSPTNDGSDDVQVTWDSEAIDLTDDPMLEPIEHKAPTIVREYYQSITNRKCFVKLVRCDNIVLNQSKGHACVDDEFKNKETTAGLISRSDSLTILEDVPTVNELNKNTIVNRENCSSPVMKVYDLIASLVEKLPIQNTRDITAVRLECYSEWMTTKRDERLQSLNVTIKQSFVVPQLTTLVLSYIQKEGLVKIISLKRKAMPSVFPDAKISKIDKPADEPTSNDCSRSPTLDLYATRSSKCFIRQEKRIIDDLDTTPDLSDTEVTDMTVSNYNDNMTLMTTEMEIEENQKAHNMKNTLMKEISDVCNCVVYDDTTLENKVTESHITMNSLDLSDNFTADFTKQHSSRKILNETSAEFSVDLVDDNPINLNILKQTKEPILIKSDMVYQNEDKAVFENKLTEAVTDSYDINPYVSEDFNAKLRTKEDSISEMSKETSAELSTNRNSDIPFDFDNQQLIQPVLMKSNLLPAYKDDDNDTVCDNDYETVLENKVVESQNEAMTDSHDINPYLSEGFISDITEDIRSKKSKETSTKLPMDRIDDIHTDLHIEKQIKEIVLMQSDLMQAHKGDDNDTVYQIDTETVLENKTVKSQKEAMTYSHDPYLSEGFISEPTKEDSISEILKETSPESIDRIDDISIDLDIQKQIEEPVLIKSDLTETHKKDDKKVTECQNRLMIDSLGINPNIYEDFVAEAAKEISNEPSVKLSIKCSDDIAIDLNPEIEEPVLINTDLVQVHKIDSSITVCYNGHKILDNIATEREKKSMVKSPIVSSDLCNSIADPFKEHSLSYMSTTPECTIDNITEDMSIDSNMQQIEELVLIKTDLVQGHMEDVDKIVHVEVFKNMPESDRDDDSDLPIGGVILPENQENYTISETSEHSERLVSKDTKLNKNSECIARSKNVIKCFELLAESKDLITAKKENITLDDFGTTNELISLHLEKPLQTTTGGDENITDSMHEPLIDQEISEVNIEDDIQLRNEIVFPKTSSSDDTNSSDETMCKKHSSSDSKSQISNKYDVPEYLNQEIKNTYDSKITKNEKTTEADKIIVLPENENSKHELQESVMNVPTIKEHHTLCKATHYPVTNDEIVDALNQMFGEQSDANQNDVVTTTRLGHNELLTNKDYKNDTNSMLNELLELNVTSIESAKRSLKDHIDKITIEKTYESNVADLPRTTDEIVTALKEIFGEPEDSSDMKEVVGTENVEHVSPSKNFITPHPTDLIVNTSHDYYNDTISVSLQKGLSLMEEPECDTVVEGIVDMLNDEIIEDITLVTLNCNERNATQVQKDNVVDESTVAGIVESDLESNVNEQIERGVHYEDPVIGTRYVFSDINRVAEVNETISQTKECKQNINQKESNIKEIEDLKIIIPKRTYSYLKNNENNGVPRRSSRNLKRKKDMSDVKTVEKKYRKGKNIDYSKITASSISELVYAKEYKRIIDYCSTIKFSYARPFHIESIDVEGMLKTWPVAKFSTVEINDPNNAEDLLYRDTEDTENTNAIRDPLERTLNEEIVNGENINNYQSIDMNEINFNMGFGERSGRVIQKIETGIIKLSAATLSDVKQYQPFSMSEITKAPNLARDTQKVKLSKFTHFINIKEKVRSVFKKMEVELTKELIQNKKNIAGDRQLSKFPFCLTSTEFIEVPRMDSVVNVVQVGQSPVSVAVQNPITCDPRVTHVSDASPQCSDNCTGEDTQSTVETKYTELTTANITLPVQEYAQNRQKSPPSLEQKPPETNDDPNESFSIVKIELMEETSQENQEKDIYDTDFSPLPSNNIEYSFEDTSNSLFNTSGNLNNTSKAETSNNVFNTSNNMDTTFTNMFSNATNMENAYSTNTPLRTETNYTNMDRASTNMYSPSPNMTNSSTVMDNAVNMNEASNLDTTTNINISPGNSTYSSMYNPMRSDSNDMNNTATNINGSATTTNMNSTSIENTTYDYSYENIEDYAANIENNNNENYTADVDNFDAVENYSADVDDYTSNMENYATNNESYRTGVGKYASSIENYATNIENYSTNVENYSSNAENTNSNSDKQHTNINNTTTSTLEEPQDLSMANSSPDLKTCNTFEKSDTSKTNQIGHATNAAGIAAQSVITSGADELANLITQSAHTTSNNYSKSTPINVMTLQQALAHVLPPPFNQTSTSDNQASNNPVSQQVLHIVQGNNAQTVINKPNGTHLLHIVQNKNNPANNGLSLGDTGLQQGGNQLIHIVNNGNQNNAQFLKRVNLLTNLTNAQGSNEQKMIQLVCKSADGKSIQLNTGHQRSMVLRLHPTTVQAAPKLAEPQVLSNSSTSNANIANGQDPLQDIKSRSVYEENYAQFIQNSGPTSSSSSKTPCQTKATSLPKFNQVFGKQSYPENKNEINNELQENSDCPAGEGNAHLEQTPEVNVPPLVPRNAPPETTQSQPSPAQQIKQTISPMNIHTTMHGGVIYTRQIPVNIGGRQTINLITVPSTELADDSAQKQLSDNHFSSQEGEQSSIIKLVPHHTSNNNVQPEENNTQTSTSNETNHTPQPVLTQMRIKLPMLSKGPHIVPGARLVRPSFFQIQRNVITGTNQPVYQQLVLTTAPPLGQTIRLPTQQGHSPHGPPVLVQTSQHPSPHIPVQQVQHAPSSQHLITPQTHSNSRPAQSHSVPPGLTKSGTVPESELSTLTLEQLREFDMVLEQVKERSVQPTPSTTPSANPCPPADSTDSPALATTSVSESTKQVLYSVENSQPTNVVSFVNRKSTITSATTSFVRSPDSSGIVDAPSSSTQVQITHTVTSKSSTSDAGSAVVTQPKKKKKKKSSSSSSTLAALGSPSKTNPLKPQEDEQTTQRILYILAEYKEQVENSPDKNKPAPRRRNQFPPTISGSKRKRHCSSRGNCRRERVDMSPMHGESGELGEDLVTLGSEDSSCGTTFSECTDCQEDHSPDSPTKVVRRLTFEETTTQITQTQTSQLPQRNVIVGDRQTITVARTTTATTAKPTTTVLMPANYLLPVSMLKGGQQIAIMTNRGPKILVGAGDNNAGALLFQRLITPGLKPVLTRPGVRHIRLPATALHNLQTFNIQTTPVTQTQPPDSTAPQASVPGPPDLVDMRAMSSPWQDSEAHDKSTRGPSPDCTEPWNLPSSSVADDYGYEEIVRTDNMERTVLDALPDRYSPDMDAQRIFDKMFDVDSKKSMYDSSRCSYDIDTSDGDDKPYPQVVQQRKDGRHHRLTHVSTAALRHKYAILEHELRLQKSLSEECEDLGVDSPSASELFPEADILFGAPSPAHEQTIDKCNTPPLISIQPTIPQPDLDDQIATDQLLTPTPRNDDLDLNLGDVDEIVTVGEDGIATIPTINAEEFARSHPNTTFHTEPEDGEIPPFTIAQSIKGRHITFHTNRVPGTVVMAPQTTVISQAAVNTNEHNTVKFIDINNMINSIPCPQPTVPSVLVKDPGSSKPAIFDILKEQSTSARKSTSKFDGAKSSGKSIPKLSKFDTVETFAPKAKFDSLKDPVTSHRPISKFDSGSSKSSSKFDSLKEPRLSTTKLCSKFDSLKDSGVSNPRPVSKFDALREPTSSKSYSKFDNLKETTPKPLSKFDSLLTESKLQLSNTSARHVLQTGHGTQVIRRLRYEGRTNTRTNSKFHFEEPRRRASISDEVKLRNDRAMVESMGDNASSPGQPELFWDSASTERQERRFQFSESEKVTKSPFDELLNDSSAYGPHTRLDSVIKAARPERTYERTSFEGINISGSSDESRPLRTYPPKRVHTQHTQETERHFTLKTTTTTTRHHEVDRTTKTTHHEVDRTKKTRCLESEGRRRTGRGLVKRGCSCCNGSPSAPPKKRSRPKKPSQESIPSNGTEPLT